MKNKKTGKKRQNKSGKKKRRSLRPSTWVLIAALVLALLACAFTWYYLFALPVSASGTFADEASDETNSADETGSGSVYIIKDGDSETEIYDIDSAMEALDEVKSEYGIDDVWEEYSPVSASEGDDFDVYLLQQYYGSLKVYGYFMKVVADPDGNLLYVTGTHAEIEDLDTDFNIDYDDAADEALEYICDTCDCDEDEAFADDFERVIYYTEDDGAEIAYAGYAGADGLEMLLVFVSGKNGGVIAAFETSDYDMTAETVEGQESDRKLSVYDNGDGTYILADTGRNIYVYDYAELGLDNADSYNILEGSIEIEGISSLDSTEKSGVDALYNAALTVDFYDDVLGRDGGNGNGGALVINIDYMSGSKSDNAARYSPTGYLVSSGITYIGICESSSSAPAYSYYLDVLAHEFTHGVVYWESYLGISSSQQSQQKAINEGIADVMAELVEDYSDDGSLNSSCDWYHTPSRDIVNQTASSGSALITDAADFEAGTTDCHTASAIISYPAYLMNQGLSGNDLLDTQQMADLYYKTIRLLCQYSNFSDFRTELEIAALLMYKSGDISFSEFETVIDAMDYSGIEPTMCSYKVESGGTLTVCGADDEPYDDYTITIEKGYEGGETVISESASDASYTLPQSLENGYYWVTLEDNNNSGLVEEFYILVNDNSSLSSGRIEDYEAQTYIYTEFGNASKEVVLVLDVSGSMGGDPIDETKEAAEEFVQTVFDETGGVKISVVIYESEVSTLIVSSDSESRLISEINGISADGSTNMYGGLQAAQDILKDSDAEYKIIVLMSDGLPNEGENDDGDYEAPLKELADEIKDGGVTIYSIGFFSELSGSEYTGAVGLMKDIASSGYYYNIASDGISGVFEDMASLVNGTTYYNITVACPVEVAISCDGQTLSSDEELGQTRTSFGSVTFEGEDEEDQTKIVRLKSGYDYEICIYGTGTGLMDYTISFPDEDGEYTDIRTFEDIFVTALTQIVSDTSSSRTSLEVDSDGDGKIDTTYTAGRNGTGKKASEFYVKIAVIVLICIAALAVLVQILLMKRRIKKNRSCQECGYIFEKEVKFCPKCGSPRHKVRIFLPEKKTLVPQKRKVKIAKAAVIAACVLIFGGNVFVFRASATKVYDQIREGMFSSALWMYDGSVDGHVIREKWLSLLLDGYLDRVEEARTGSVSDSYAGSVYETVSELNLDKVSAKADEYYTGIYGTGEENSGLGS